MAVCSKKVREGKGRPMLDGLDHVWKSAQILAGRDAMLKARLKEAAGEFFVSRVQPDEWPKDLLERARRLSGKLQGIDGMDDATARQVAEELLALAADVNAAFQRGSL